MAAVSIPLVSTAQEPMPLASAEQPSAGCEFLGQLEALIKDSAQAGEHPAESLPLIDILNLLQPPAAAAAPGAFGMPSDGVEAGDSQGANTQSAAIGADKAEIDVPAPRPAPAAPADLAFAVRLLDQPAAVPRPHSGSDRPPLHEIAQPFVRPEGPQESVSGFEPVRQDLAQPTNATAPIAAAAARYPVGTLDLAQPVAAASAPEAVETASPPSTPVKEVTEISLSLGPRPDAPAHERIAIRMVQKAGEVHVSVRTPDQDLTQSLRQNLARLNAALDDAGFHAETWRPPEQVSHAPREFAPDTSRRQPDADAQSGGGHGERRRQRRNPQNRPGWVSELAAHRIQ